jgi:hypothetical protein
LRIDVAGFQPLRDAARAAFDRQHAHVRHGCRQRLRAAHAAQARGQYPFAGKRIAEMASAHFGEGLVSPLHDALAADVDPGAGGHLPVHGEPLAVELVEVFPRGPVRHQIGIGDEHARRVGVSREHADRFAGLHQQGLLLGQALQRLDDAVVAVPIARGSSDAAVNHELVGILRDFRIEIVHQHAQRRLGHPGAGAQGAAARGADDAGLYGSKHG